MNERTVLVIVVIIGLLGLLVIQHASASRKLGGEVGQCFYANQCRYENHGFGVFVGYNEHVCTGAWAAYGHGWVRDNRCVYPEPFPKTRR